MKIITLISLILLSSVALGKNNYTNYDYWPPLYDAKIRGCSNNHTWGQVRTNSDGSKRWHDGWDLYSIDGDMEAKAISRKSTVVYTGKIGNYGNVVLLKDTTSIIPIYPMYAHLKNIKVKKGDILNGGDVVGIVGRTGYENNHSIPTHLHFEIWLSFKRGAGNIPISSRGRISPLQIFGDEMFNYMITGCDKKTFKYNLRYAKNNK